MKNKIIYLFPVFILACMTPIATASTIPQATAILPQVAEVAPTGQPTTAAQSTKTANIRYVTADVLELRSCPSEACRNIGYLYYGQSLTVTGQFRTEAESCKVWANVGSGYVCERWLR